MMTFRGSRRALAGGAVLALLVSAAVLPLPALASRGIQTVRPAQSASAAKHATAIVARTGRRLKMALWTLSGGAFATTAEAFPFGGALDWQWQNPKPTGVGLADVHFVNATTGWATGQGTMIKTTDGGATWAAQDAGPDFSGTDLEFTDANSGWCLSQGATEVVRTTDGGAHWLDCDVFGSEGITGDYASNMMSSISFPTGSTGYIVEQSQKVHKTTDGGVTWKVLGSTVNTWPEAVDFVDANTGWLVGANNFVLETTDGGTTWSKKGSPVTYPYSSFDQVDFVSADVGWVSAYDGLFKTVDSGATWKQQAAVPDTYELGRIHFLDASHGWVIASGPNTAPLEEQHALIMRTEDGGEHWSQIDIGVNTGISGVSFVDAAHGWAAGARGTGGSILDMTTDGGQTWSSETSGTTSNLYDVSSSSTSTAIASGADGTIVRTTDGGGTWALRDSETTQTLWALASAGASETWAVGNEGVIRHTSDGGQTWQAQDSGTSAWLGNTWFIDSQHGWATGSQGTMLKTIDGGAHWTPIATAPLADLYIVQFVDQNTGWVTVDGDPSMYKTVSGGASWTPQVPQFWSSDMVQAVAFADAQHGWAASYYGDIAHTADGGLTWTPQYLRVSAGCRALHALSATSAVVVTTQGQILRTDNGGDSWWLQVTPAGRMNDFDFASNSVGWVVGDNGMIAKTTDGGGTAPLPSQLSGTVRSAVTHKPIAGAGVSLETYPTVHTDASGHYQIDNIMPAYYETMTFYKAGYTVGIVPGGVFMVDDDQSVQDFDLTVKTFATVSSARSVHGKLAASGVVSPRRKTTVTLEYSRLVGKSYVHKSSVKIKTSTSGKFSYSRKLAKGTWRVRAGVAAGKGYSSALSGWKVVKVR